MTLLDQPDTPVRASDDPEGSRAITIVDPQDGSLVGTVHSADEADVAAAITAAVGASEGWAATPPAARGALLHAMADGLAARADEVAALNTRETGKPAGDARGGVDAAVGTLRQYAELGPLHRTHSLRGADVAVDFTRPEPRGVVAALTPWNDPVAVAAGLRRRGARDGQHRHPQAQRTVPARRGAARRDLVRTPARRRPDHAHGGRPHRRGAGPLRRGPRRRPRRLHRHRPRDRRGGAAHRRPPRPGERRERRPGRRRRRRPRVGRRPGRARRVREQRPDLHLGGADLRARRRRRGVRGGARRGGRPAERGRHGPAGRRADAGRGAPPGRRRRGRGGAGADRGRDPDRSGCALPGHRRRRRGLRHRPDARGDLRARRPGPGGRQLRGRAQPRRRLALRARGDRADRFARAHDRGRAAAAGGHGQDQRRVRRGAGRRRASRAGRAGRASATGPSCWTR